MVDLIGNSTIKTFWNQLVQTSGEKPFVTFQSSKGATSSFTYGEFNDHINMTSNLLISLGVLKGDCVAIHLKNCPEYLIALFAIMKIGAIAVPINPSYMFEEIDYILKKAHVNTVFCESYTACYYIGFKPAIQQKNIICIDGKLERCIDFKEVLQNFSQAEPLNTVLDSMDVAEIIFTSGTTSRPKGVMLTHANMIYSGFYGAWEASIGPDDILLTTMPACHVNFQTSGMMPVIAAGAQLVCIEHYSATRFWRQCVDYKATHTQGIAMMVRTMMMQEVQPWEREACVREVLYYLPITDEEKIAFEKRFNTKILNSYGSSETLDAVIADPPIGPRRWPSIGKPGLGYKAKIVNEKGFELDAGEVGEIVISGVRGRSVMLGYFDDLKSTDEVFDDQGWLRTGDVGYVDEDGWFYFLDRKKDVIKRAGENISAAEIENVIYEVPGVKEVAVVGVFDPVYDQKVVAYVIANSSSTVLAEKIRSHCESSLACFKIPSEVYILKEFPRSALGKISKKVLVQNYQN